jgi:hypothetical protein
MGPDWIALARPTIFDLPHIVRTFNSTESAMTLADGLHEKHRQPKWAPYLPLQAAESN